MNPAAGATYYSSSFKEPKIPPFSRVRKPGGGILINGLRNPRGKFLPPLASPQKSSVGASGAAFRGVSVRVRPSLFIVHCLFCAPIRVSRERAPPWAIRQHKNDSLFFQVGGQHAPDVIIIILVRGGTNQWWGAVSSWGSCCRPSVSRGARIVMLSGSFAVSSPLGIGGGDPSSRCREEREGEAPGLGGDRGWRRSAVLSSS